MPLFHSSTKRAFRHNVSEELKHGKKRKQAVAIAYKIKREHKSKRNKTRLV